MKHVLIIGGTGMLSGVTDYFINQGNKVTLLSRFPERLNLSKFGNNIQNRIKLIKQNYINSSESLQEVKNAVRDFGAVDIAVLWIHTIGAEFSQELKHYLLSEKKRSTKVYELSGIPRINIENTNPAENSDSFSNQYRKIILGYKIENSVSRWLTDREISEGTIEAIENDTTYQIIGLVGPIENRP